MRKRIVSFVLAVVFLVTLVSNIITPSFAATDVLGPRVINGGRRDFKWPVPGYYNIQSCFYDQRNHCAIDISAPQGTPIVAAYDGTVIQSFNGGYGDGFGNYVVLQHNYQLLDGTYITLYSRYSHMYSVSVNVGDQVRAGKSEVGKVGTTGASEGNHLDFQILYGNWQPYQTYSIDPYANELLELPESIQIYDSWACGAQYYEEVKKIYQKVPYPEKATLNFTVDDDVVTLSWEPTANTTHYNLWLAKKNESGEWETVEQIFYAESGLSRELEDGEYRAQLLSYNSNGFEADGSDWLHTWADDVFFTVDTRVTVTFYDADGNVWLQDTCSVDVSYTIPDEYPRKDGSYFSGWGYTEDAEAYIARPNTAHSILVDTAFYPVYVTHADAVSGEPVLIYNIEDFDQTGYEITQTEKAFTTQMLSNAYWADDWSDYSTQWVEASDTVQVRTAPMYRYYYYLCPSCGTHEPFKGTSDCGATIPDSAWIAEWFATPYNQCGYQTFSYTNSKYYTTSLGDGHVWCFSAGNVNDTAIGTIDSDGSAEVITTGYSSRSLHVSYQDVEITAKAYIIQEIAEETVPDALTFTLNEDGVSYSVTDCDTAAMGELVIPATYEGLPVTGIGYAAFSWCNSLTSITIPDSVTNIGDYAFQQCSSLTGITIPDGVTTIGKNAFYVCTGLTSITIPESVSYIGAFPFGACSNLKEIVVESGNQHYTSIDGILYSIDKTVLIQVPGSVTGNYVISDSVKTIGEGAFVLCEGLTGIHIPDGVTSIGTNAFFNCNRLISINIPDSVTTINNHAFSRCSSLSAVEIPEGITFIGDGVFYGCSSLLSINIPSSVGSIGSRAFQSCTNLAGIAIPVGVTSIGSHAFRDCSSLTSITIPASVTEIGDIAFDSCPVEHVLYTGTQAQWESIEGLTEELTGASVIHYEADGTEVGCMEHNGELKEYCTICGTFMDGESLPNVTVATMIAENVTVKAGETVEMTIVAKDLPAIKSLMLESFQYDADALELVDVQLQMADAVIADWDSSEQIATVAFSENTDINGTIMTLTFQVSNTAEGDYTVSFQATANQRQGAGTDAPVEVTAQSGTVTVVTYQRGDVNGDGYVNSDDAIYLLRHTLSSNRYPINQSGDMNGDGYVNSDDAIYLLRHTLSPSRYPLK